MEFTRQNPSARFVVPDKITVRQQMAYFSAGASAPALERLWVAAVPLITEWECELFPNHETSLDDVDNLQMTQVLIWAGLQVKRHIDSLDDMPKN